MNNYIMPIDRATLEAVIKASGGGVNTEVYIEPLLEKLNQLQAHRQYQPLLEQLLRAKNPGDLRGRVLEVNFARAFLQKQISLEYGAKQGGKGDIDFCWNTELGKVHVELKLLGEQQAIQTAVHSQLASGGIFQISQADDTQDVGRIQRDIFGKSSPSKFNPIVVDGCINLVGVDVSELQLGAIDECDCVHAVGGANMARCHFDHAFIRPAVVGALEPLREHGPDQKSWVDRYHPQPEPDPHPRSYIHGVVFLFRTPSERAALSYELQSCIVWNPGLIDIGLAKKVAEAWYGVLSVRTNQISSWIAATN
ncbi:hypothetical protein [Polaromonas sp.]|uniref:hypothetical protein n=1 Tax=Polaromonas sp. TaxID=1869339 RepID=UPI002FCAA561